MDDKTKALVAHLTIIGWIIAYVQNQTDKGDLTSFYLRQNLGFYAIGVLIWLILMILSISIITWILYLGWIAIWVMSLLGALSGEKKPTPYLGDMFQQWFKGIS